MIVRNMNAVLIVAAVIALGACEQEGPAERAGAQLDNALEEAQERFDDARDEVEDAIEDAREALEEE